MTARRSRGDLLGAAPSVDDAAPATGKRRTFSCGRGDNLGAITHVEKLTADQFAERISKPRRDKRTEREFHALTADTLSKEEREAGKKKQDAIKMRAGWYVPGKFAGSRRNRDSIRFRTAVTLDIDNATPELLAEIKSGRHKRLARLLFVAHETHKSTKHKPRIRIVVFLAGRVEADAFPTVARAVARKLGFDPAELDPKSFDAQQPMYWPSRPADSSYWWASGEGEPLDPASLNLDEDGAAEAKERVREPAGDLATTAHNTRQFETFDELAEAVMAVKNDDRFEFRDAWRDFIAAIKFESEELGCEEEGRELAHEWSAKWECGDHAEHTDKTWDTLRNDRSKKLRTGGTILKYAREDGWRPKPKLGYIELRSAELNENLGTLDSTMADNAESLDFYRRAGMFQHVAYEKQPAIFEGEKADDVLALSVVRTSPRQMQQIAMKACKFEKYDERRKKGNKRKKTECPKTFAEHYLDMAAPSKVPVLHSLIDHPTIRPDGSILQTPGFDRATGLLYLPEIEFPRVPDKPSKVDALAALRRLKKVLRKFEFDSDLDRTVWLSAALTALVRDSLRKAPFFAFDAPLAGSGKTILASGVSTIARGFTAKPVPYAEEEELRKTLASLLLENSPFVFFDNCEGPIKSATLNIIATSDSWKPRLLGVNRTPNFSTNVTVMFTGNNMEIVGDLIERTLICRLQPKTERPTERKFDFSFEGECRDKRARLVTDALTIIRAYILSGADLDLPGGRFDEWDRFVRLPLAWLGEGDVLEKIELLRQVATAEDTDGQFLRKLVEAWWEEFGGDSVRLGEIKEDSNTGRLLELLSGRFVRESEGFAEEKFDAFNKRSAGKFLAQHKGRVVAGKFFVQKLDRKGVAVWRLEKVES